MKAVLIIALVLCFFFFTEVKAVNQCYKCITPNCGTFTKQHCLSSSYSCWSSSFVLDGQLMQRKECAAKTSQVLANCNTIIQLMGGKCYLCDEELCNAAW